MKQLEIIFSPKQMKVSVVFLLLGSLLIFTQYFGLFPLSEEYALDMLHYYSYDTFFGNLRAMDEVSRRSYLMIHAADYLFMAGFYPFIGGLIFKRYGTKYYLILIPLAAFLFDFVENVMFDIHLIFYPTEIAFFGYIAGVVTFLKFLFLYSAFIIFLVLAIRQTWMNKISHE